MGVMQEDGEKGVRWSRHEGMRCRYLGSIFLLRIPENA